MNWQIIEENERKYADESYYLKATRKCDEGELVLTIEWAQFIYILTVELFSEKRKGEWLFSTTIFYNDRIEKYGHQIIRMTEKNPVKVLNRLNSMQKDGVLNFVLSEKYGVTFETPLSKKNGAQHSS